MVEVCSVYILEFHQLIIYLSCVSTLVLLIHNWANFFVFNLLWYQDPLNCNYNDIKSVYTLLEHNGVWLYLLVFTNTHKHPRGVLEHLGV